MWKQREHLPPFEALDPSFDIDEYFEEYTEIESISRFDLDFALYWWEYDFWEMYRCWNIKVSGHYCWVYDTHYFFELDDDMRLTTEELITEAQKLIDSFWFNYPSPNQLILPGLEAFIA